MPHQADEANMDDESLQQPEHFASPTEIPNVCSSLHAQRGEGGGDGYRSGTVRDTASLLRGSEELVLDPDSDQPVMTPALARAFVPIIRRLLAKIEAGEL